MSCDLTRCMMSNRVIGASKLTSCYELSRAYKRRCEPFRPTNHITTIIMDKTTSVLAALDAGKLPDQNQINQSIDWVLVNFIAELESGTGGDSELSKQGRVIAGGVREILRAYKQLGSNKNGRWWRACMPVVR